MNPVARTAVHGGRFLSPWHVIYARLNRPAKNGVFQRVYASLTAQGLKAEKARTLDSTTVKVHLGAYGARKKLYVYCLYLAGLYLYPSSWCEHALIPVPLVARISQIQCFSWDLWRFYSQ
jgi:hypothetical protein